MSHSKIYRSFIILQEDERNSSENKDKALSGYSKIEEKGDRCKVSFYSQNLRKDTPYSVVLICCKKDLKQIIDLGPLTVEDGGKGEVVREYNSKNIAQLNITRDKISGAGIYSTRSGEIEYVIYGFINGEKVDEGWKNYKIIKEREESIEVIKNNEEIRRVDKYKREKVEKIEKIEKKIEDPKCSEVEIKEQIEEKIYHKDKNDDHEYKLSRNDFEEYEMQIEREKDIDYYDFKLKGSTGEFFEDIASEFEEVKNKFKEIKYCKWYKVKIDNIDKMCDTSNYNKYTIIYYPMLNYYPYIRKHGYFFVGYKCDKRGNVKYIVYGIPGTKAIEEQPYMGKTGFVTWMRTYSDEMGCWLMFYDYKLSMVAVPTKD